LIFARAPNPLEKSSKKYFTKRRPGTQEKLCRTAENYLQELLFQVHTIQKQFVSPPLIGSNHGEIVTKGKTEESGEITQI
jgi:hypothetical protein